MLILWKVRVELSDIQPDVCETENNVDLNEVPLSESNPDVDGHGEAVGPQVVSGETSSVIIILGVTKFTSVTAIAPSPVDNPQTGSPKPRISV